MQLQLYQWMCIYFSLVQLPSIRTRHSRRAPAQLPTVNWTFYYPPASVSADTVTTRAAATLHTVWWTNVNLLMDYWLLPKGKSKASKQEVKHKQLLLLLLLLLLLACLEKSWRALQRGWMNWKSDKKKKNWNRPNNITKIMSNTAESAKELSGHAVFSTHFVCTL